MQHLDEGTVHSWLDGELPETESVAAAQHVAECAQCAALVAEARGVIAGAARVVAALDVGPAGVIPKAQHARGAGFWRRLTRSPARMAMAATILVAVGVTLTVRRAPRDRIAPRPAVDETPVVLSSPATPAANAVGAPASPAQGSSAAAKLKDRAASAAATTPAPAAAPTASTGDQAGLGGGARKQSTAIVGGALNNALADKKKEADTRRDQPAPAAPRFDQERAKSVSTARTSAEVTPQIQAAPPTLPALRDSLAMRQGLAKVAADSTAARSAAPTVRRLEAAASAGQLREAGAQAQSSRAAASDAISEASLQGCYRLSVDTSEWRGVLPAAFVLTGPSSRVQGAAGGQGAAPQAAASTNAAQRFAQKPELAGFGVHAIGANGQADSTKIGDWTTAGPATALVRFANVDHARPVMVLISNSSPFARVTAGTRTDSLRVTRILCPR